MKALRLKPKRKRRPPREIPLQQDCADWRLLSGQRLTEFVLRSGLVAPRLLVSAPKES
jgi:hypothetical protein